MYGFGYQNSKVLDGSASYGVWVDAVIARANTLGYTLPSSATLSDLQTRLANIGDTALNKLDVFHIYSPDVGTTDFFTLNMVDPLTHQATLVNSPTVAIDGILTDGVSSYIDTNYDPFAGSNLTLNDNHFGLILSQGIGTAFSYVGGVRDSGVGGATNFSLAFLGSANRDYSNDNDTAIYTTPSNILSGFKVIQRTSSTAVAKYHNGTLVSNYSNASVRIPNVGNIMLGGWNTNGAIANHSVNKYAAFTVGASLTTVEMATINTEITAFYGR